MFVYLYMVETTNNKQKEAQMAKLKKQPQSNVNQIDRDSLVQFLISKKGSASIMEILLHFQVIQDPSDINSSKRAILRKARKGWTTKDDSHKVKGKHYWTFVDDKVDFTFEDYTYKSKKVYLLDEKGAKDQGLI